jgi:hypothetical protein
MEQMAIYWFIVAWLGCWAVDLAAACRASPVPLTTLIKLIIVVVCLMLVLFLFFGGGFAPLRLR